ncbi:MAG: cytochrome c oxidase subunit II [Rhodospirillales bacterium 20-60-12]|nr:MAG: cytochrome c oxidase subunit II [Rhodospirillales bacterium 20-60-12]HQT66337.1 cytochrome c oxidase subunit II [Acetobacteraceae bacterium]
MRFSGWRVSLGALVLLAFGMPHLAFADGYVIAPKPWEMWLPQPGSPMEARIDHFMAFVLWIMAGVVGFVALLLAYVIVRFNAKRNKVPSTVTHNVVVEVLWTVIPAVILLVVAWPSINLIRYEADYQKPYMIVKVTGHQWYWEYDYKSVKGLDFTSYMIPDDKLQPGQIRRLSVDHPMVVPAGEKIEFEITSADVLHGFYLPSLGVQRYAIPGQIVHSWTLLTKPGTYYGECNQICGINHDAMPIEIQALPMDQYQAWVKKAQAEYADNTPNRTPAVVRPALVQLAQATR